MDAQGLRVRDYSPGGPGVGAVIGHCPQSVFGLQITIEFYDVIVAFRFLAMRDFLNSKF